jgi:exodeoxyribonuclease V alpha subunit
MVELEGVIEEIVFRNESNGFTVLELKIEKDLITAVGCIPFAHEGERVKLGGEWTQHPDYGKQLKVSTCETVAPATLTGMERYLASGLIRGVGPVTARKIVECFGLDSLDIIQFYPDRLTEVDGIGPSKAATIAESFSEQRDIREIMLFLQSYGISTNYAIKIYKLYGNETINKIRENPYRLADDIVGIGFKRADKIAQSMGIDPSDKYRLTAGTKYVLSQAAGHGHTYLPREELVQKAAALLNADEELVDHAIVTLAVNQEIILEEREDHTAVYQAPFYQAEAGVSMRLPQLSMTPVDNPLLRMREEMERIQAEEGILFAPEQQEAIIKAMENSVVVITGGPGTGKTTIINCIIKLFEKLNMEVTLAAPTGRAAKRMTQATGREAKTIHRLLEYSFGDEGEDKFQRNEDNPLYTDVLIVDEVSMVDILLMNHLMKALLPGARLILVGDVDQLPSVGPGNVLRDIIDSKVVTVVYLSQIFRQAQESMIVVNAHRINRGEPPYLNVKDKDFYLERKESPEDILRTVIDLCDRRLPDYYGFDPMKDIQVLAPMKKGTTGVYNLNVELQKALNPKSRRKNEKTYGDTVFREGDKVMQIKNNYQMTWTRTTEEGAFLEEGEGVFNGDVGFIEQIDPEEQKVIVLFDDDKRVEYEYSQLDELELAYAVSIHKSQGSEFPVILLPLTWGPPMLMTRNLLYTAVTRAKSLVVIVGRDQSIYSMVRNNYISRRYSGLQWRLREML